MAARGLSGDNLTLLCVMGFGVMLYNRWAPKVERGVDSVANALELGKNSAGPMQSESTAEISSYEAEVRTWHYDPQKFPKGRKIGYYKAIADKIFNYVKSRKGLIDNIDEDYLIGLCKPLDANELRALAKQFGVREWTNLAGFTTWSGHIFHLWDSILTDTYFGGNDLTNMKTVWSKSGLWL